MASESTMMPIPGRLWARNRTVSPITGLRGLRPTIISPYLLIAAKVGGFPLAATPLHVSSHSSRPVEPSKARGVDAGADGDRLADRIVDHVRHLLGQHVSGVRNMHMLCAAAAGAHFGG